MESDSSLGSFCILGLLRIHDFYFETAPPYRKIEKNSTGMSRIARMGFWTHNQTAERRDPPLYLFSYLPVVIG